MALGRLIDDNYSPEEIDIMTCAFNAAMRALKVRDHGSPQGVWGAKLIVKLVQGGMRDPAAICEKVMQAQRTIDNEFNFEAANSYREIAGGRGFGL